MKASQDQNEISITWLSEYAAAKYLGFSHSWKMRSIQVRRYDLRSMGAKKSKYRYKKTDLDEFLKSRESVPEAETA